MTQTLLEAEPMARKAKEAKVGTPDAPAGPAIRENLCRLGFCETVIRSAEIAKLVEQKTGRTMSRQRISQIVNAVTVDAETVETLAKALGVKPAELTKRSK